MVPHILSNISCTDSKKKTHTPVSCFPALTCFHPSKWNQGRSCCCSNTLFLEIALQSYIWEHITAISGSDCKFLYWWDQISTGLGSVKEPYLSSVQGLLILQSQSVLVKVSSHDWDHANFKTAHYKYLAYSDPSAKQFNIMHAYLRYLRESTSFDFISHLTIYILFLNEVIFKSSLLILKPKNHPEAQIALIQLRWTHHNTSPHCWMLLQSVVKA